jgi:hypothetical protein
MAKTLEELNPEEIAWLKRCIARWAEEQHKAWVRIADDLAYRPSGTNPATTPDIAQS